MQLHLTAAAFGDCEAASAGCARRDVQLAASWGCLGGGTAPGLFQADCMAVARGEGPEETEVREVR